MALKETNHIKPFNEKDVKVSRVATHHGSKGTPMEKINIDNLIENQRDVDTFKFFWALGDSLDYITIVNLYTTVH